MGIPFQQRRGRQRCDRVTGRQPHRRVRRQRPGPRAITPVRDFNGIDYGDTDAWILGGKVFVQAEASCGPEFLGLQHRDGTVTAVEMPGNGSGSLVDAITGDQMMITRADCEGHNLLIRFDPLTGSARMVFAGS
jgi:hypothetical protein